MQDAQAQGCWKSDGSSGATTPPTLKLTAAGIAFAAVAGWTTSDPLPTPAADSCVDTHTIHEQLCGPPAQYSTTPDGKGVSSTAQTGVPLQLFAANHPCPAGTSCQAKSLYGVPSAACLPVPTGCPAGQVPFLDATGDGQPDVCTCPADTFAVDTNSDDKSDSCTPAKPGSAPQLCAAFSKGAVQGAAAKASLATEGLLLYDVCASSAKLTHYLCAADGTFSKSSTLCGAGEVCVTKQIPGDQPGTKKTTANCVASAGTVCKEIDVLGKQTTAPNDLHTQGKVALWLSPQSSSAAYDRCATDTAFDLNPATPWLEIGAVEKVACSCAGDPPACQPVWSLPKPCPAGEVCVLPNPQDPAQTMPAGVSTGICVPQAKADVVGPDADNDFDNDGTPNADDPDDDNDGQPDATDPDDDNDNTPDADDPDDDNDGSPDSNDPPCNPKVTPACTEVSDATHPIDPVDGTQLYGDPLLFGTTTLGADVELCPGLLPGVNYTPPQEFAYPDLCAWYEYEAFPTLTQYGCDSPSASNKSTSYCNWAQGFACNWQAGTAELAGVCQKIAGKAQVTASAGAATTPAKVTGINAFGDPVEHVDSCLPAQGNTAYQHWELFDNPAGAIATTAYCPDQHHCAGGVCVPDPCLNISCDDDSACTEDACDPGSGACYNTPALFDSAGAPLDDQNLCTIDLCAEKNGIAVITHTPISGGNCAGWAFCEEHPDDPSCAQVDPDTDCTKNPAAPGCAPQQVTIDCAKMPDNPECPPPPANTDCSALPKPAECPGDVTIDCTKTPENPACSPFGGFDCAPCADPGYAAQHPECAQCEQSLLYCEDEDVANDPAVKGTVWRNFGTPQQAMVHDMCTDWSDTLKIYTAVQQAACGPSLAWFFTESSCPPNTLGCLDGACVPKEQP